MKRILALSVVLMLVLYLCGYTSSTPWKNPVSQSIETTVSSTVCTEPPETIEPVETTEPVATEPPLYIPLEERPKYTEDVYFGAILVCLDQDVLVYYSHDFSQPIYELQVGDEVIINGYAIVSEEEYLMGIDIISTRMFQYFGAIEYLPIPDEGTLVLHVTDMNGNDLGFVNPIHFLPNPR